MVRHISTFTVLFVLVLAAPAFASNADAIAGTPSVKAKPAHHGTAIVFTGKRGRALFKRVAGHLVDIECEQSPDDDLIGGLITGNGTEYKAPKRGGKLFTDSTSRTADWCQVLVVRKDGARSPVVAVALSSKGSIFLDERWRAADMLGFVTFESITPNGQQPDHYPATAQIVADLKGAVLGLASPNDTVAPGQFGIYSDGAQHIETVAVTPVGRRLFLDLNGDTVSSNVLGQLNSLNFD